MGDKAIITMLVEKKAEGYAVEATVINASTAELLAAYSSIIKNILERAKEYNMKAPVIGELTRILVESSQEGEYHGSNKKQSGIIKGEGLCPLIRGQNRSGSIDRASERDHCGPCDNQQ